MLAAPAQIRQSAEDMQLASLALQGFRCFGVDAPVVVEFDELTAFVGVNGSGKTAVLVALSRMFGTTNAARTLTKDDFHTPLDGEVNPTELGLTLEARFAFPELMNEEDAASSHAVPECLRHILADDGGGAPVCRIRLTATWSASASVQGDIEQRLEWISSLEENPLDDAVHPLNAQERSLIQVHYVPAARDAVHELRAVSGTILSRALGHIDWSDEIRDRLLELSENMSEELRTAESFQRLESALQAQWKDLRGEGVGTPELSLAETDLSTLLRRIDPRLVRPSTATQALTLLSEGERSLMYFALVASSLEFESHLAASAARTDLRLPALTLLAVEEPENHLAPQYLSRILHTLRAINRHRTAQVTITSHSASILRRVEPTEVRHFRVDDTRGHIVTRITLPEDTDEAHKYVREAVRAYPELYFARVVILGEGPTEEVVLPRFADTFGLDIDPKFVAVVPLGGRHVNHFWRLLRTLGTPFVTLVDLDAGRAGGAWGRLHRLMTILVEYGEDPRNVHSALSGVEFGGMPKWEYPPADGETLTSWLEHLEEHFHIYFSAPLDLDLLMLTSFPDTYKALAKESSGPHPIPREPKKRTAKLNRLAYRVLGDAASAGTTAYTNDDIELFAWYGYLFLSGSKPSAHTSVLADLDDDAVRLFCVASSSAPSNWRV